MSDNKTLCCRLHKQTPAHHVVEGSRDVAVCPVCGRECDRETAVRDATEYLAAREMHDAVQSMARSLPRPKKDDIFQISLEVDDRAFRSMREPDFVLV